MAPVLTYPGAPETLIALWDKRRGRLGFADGEALPAPDADLAALARTVAAAAEPLPKGASGHATKAHALRLELQGYSELAVLHAVLVSHLRKRRQPRVAAPLFLRIWAEHGPQLITELPPRWLISAAITFGDHGTTPAQRLLGHELNVLFSLMKLYEFERLHSGQTPDAPFRRKRVGAPLPMGMEPFALATGGLDINLLAPIWARAVKVPVLGPLACHLLERLNAEPGGVFRRIGVMRAELAAKRAAKRMGKPAET